METCKLCVSIPGKSLKLDMPRTDAEVWFTTLVDALLNTQSEEEPERDEDTENECDQEEQGYPIETIAQELREKIESTQETAPPKSVIEVKGTRSRTERAQDDQDDQDEREGYRGFLRIRCDVCGEIRGFNAKQQIRSSWCPCGKYTPLIDLDKITARCSVCGHTWVYRTNNTEPLDEITCLECSAPITLEQDKHGNYQTIATE